MKKTVVINIVGLTQRLIGKHTPFIKSFQEKAASATVDPVLPAVTCSVQSTYLTGKWPSEHGIVGNGWYTKEQAEINFWKQSNKNVQGEKIWDLLKKENPNFTCSNMFWWYNMYSNADYSVTPRPNYLADGRKIPDCYSHPSELRDTLQKELGMFPLFNYWGPKTSIKCSKWIADASMRTDALHDPTLTLIYLPHMDYNTQRHGIDFDKIGNDLEEIDAVVKDLVEYYSKKDANIILLSEYGITNVDQPVHLNRILRKEGYLGIRMERGLELLDAGASKVFAVSDHQVGHIYLNDLSLKDAVVKLMENTPGIEQVLTGESRAAAHLDHERAGDIVVVADKNSWFTYYFWDDDTKAPDYARMVDIHKKPGYDPVEMLTDPADKLVMPKVAWKLLRKKMGFRQVLDIIPLKAELIKGSHGRIPEDPADHPIFITNRKNLLDRDRIQAIDVFDLMRKHVVD